MQIATIFDLKLKHVLIQEGKFATLDSTKILLRKEIMQAVQRKNKCNAAKSALTDSKAKSS